jgi:mRNA-degrading endonuclease RelE of RelBE toxin-antitoxin system
MNYRIITTPPFEKAAKRLSKKYPLIKKDIKELAGSLKINPIQGDSLGKDCYKVRIQISGKNTGKSGGARVIINVKIIAAKVYLLTIYDKADKSTLLRDELDELMENL